jgi:hypothetical protein
MTFYDNPPEVQERELIFLIQEKMDALNPGDITEVKHLFDEDVWDSLDKALRRYFSRIITALAEAKKIPLAVYRTPEGHRIFTPDRHNLFIKLEQREKAHG